MANRQTKARGKRPSQTRFAQIPSVKIQRSVFKRNHGLKTAFFAGDLVPIFVDEVMPGDSMRLQAKHFTRLATPIHPVLHDLYLDTFFFFVPYRLVWDRWVNFMGEELNRGDATQDPPVTYETPQVIGTWNTNSQGDYMGIPPGVVTSVSALPFRALALIFNEWFRDENLVDKVPVFTDAGPDPLANYQTLYKRGKRHDYFTSALPWPQKGPAVNIPVAGSADVVPTGTAPTFEWNGLVGTIHAQDTNEQLTANVNSNWTGQVDTFWDNPQLQVDLNTITATTVNALREAFQLQRMYERDARGGTRYTELIRSHYGVISPDARLQRPEYLGGGSTRIMQSIVPNTAAFPSGTPLGELASYMTGASTGDGFSTRSFTEHGVIIGLINLRAELSYQQGIERFWSRKTRFDHYWPSLAHLGEQQIENREIYAQGNAADSEVFGYQERYAEYRYKPSLITGIMRSNLHNPPDDPEQTPYTTLHNWHLAQNFETPPVLNAEFITEDPPIDRMIAVPSEPHALADFAFNYVSTRPMPTYGVPGLIDHF